MTTTKDEAIKMAIEALESLYLTLTPDSILAKSLRDRIDIIREALAEQEPEQNAVFWVAVGRSTESGKLLYWSRPLKSLEAAATVIRESWKGLANATVSLEILTLYDRPQPTKRESLTEETITRGAKALCNRWAKECGLDSEHSWLAYKDYFINEARDVLEAVHWVLEETKNVLD